MVRFLIVAAGFGLTKADLFPIVAARGAAQIILVRKLAVDLLCIWFHTGCSTEYCFTLSAVLAHRACVYAR